MLVEDALFLGFLEQDAHGDFVLLRPEGSDGLIRHLTALVALSLFADEEVELQVIVDLLKVFAALERRLILLSLASSQAALSCAANSFQILHALLQLLVLNHLHERLTEPFFHVRFWGCFLRAGVLLRRGLVKSDFDPGGQLATEFEAGTFADGLQRTRDRIQVHGLLLLNLRLESILPVARS